MARGDREWAALRDALKTTTPPCTDDIRFVLDRPSEADQAAMSTICSTCPIRDTCAAYARATKPPGTYWAGTYYAPKEG